MNLSKEQNKSLFEKEYRSFLLEPGQTPPAHVSRHVHTRIVQDLTPSLGQAISQLILSHIIFVTLLLLICPHFGISIIPGFKGLKLIFALCGGIACKIFCGFTIMGLSLYFCAKTLPAGVFRQLKPYRFQVIILLSLATMLSLAIIGGGRIRWIPEAPAWLFGALVGGYLLFKAKPKIYTLLK